MTTRIPLSAAAERTSAPAISALMQMALADPTLISLAAGFVDQNTLPIESTAKGIARFRDAHSRGLRALQYGTTAGDPGLRRRVLNLLEREENVESGTFEHHLQRTIVTTGSQQLLYLVAEALLDPGDVVIVESPTYFVFLGVLQSRGARIVGVETDEEGLKVEALDATLSDLRDRGLLNRVKLIYTVSEHSNPSGVSLAADRRGRLVEMAQRWSTDHRIFILEDAAYRGLTFEGDAPPSVWSQDAHGEYVILARTFSKTFSPGLKLGYAILPLPLVEPVLRLKGNHDFGSANFNQLLVNDLIEDGSYLDQIQLLKGIYRRKRDATLAAMEDHLGGWPGVRWTRPDGGLYVWLTLPEQVETGLGSRLFQRCLSEGVLYVPGEYAFAEEPGPVPRNHIRLCFGVPDEAELAEGVRRFSLAMRDCLATATPT